MAFRTVFAFLTFTNFASASPLLVVSPQPQHIRSPQPQHIRSPQPQQKSAILSKIRVSQPSSNSLRWISERYEISGRSGSNFEVILPAAQVQSLAAKVSNVEVLEANLAAQVRAQLKKFENPSVFPISFLEVGDALQQNLEVFRFNAKSNQNPRYRKLKDVYEWMRGMAKAAPGLVKLNQYGTSGRGNPLMMLTVGRGQESQVMLTAATHGDELITVEVLLALTERLVAGDGISPRLTSILNSRLIHIVPVVNPDGFSSQDRYEGDTDPNRSYPAPGREKNRPTPSIAALIRFFQATPIKASVDFHASGSLVMYPWAYTDDAIEDTAAGKAAEFSQLAANMAAQNSYRSGQISRILYPAVGSSCDFYFWKKQSRSLAIELGSEKVPHPSEIPEYIESQVESTWVFLESI